MACSTVTANLAIALASTGKDVICVEADMRRPRLMHYLDMPSTGAGLADALEGRVDLRSALKDVPLPAPYQRRLPTIRSTELIGGGPSRQRGRLRALMSGTPHGDPADLLTSQRAAEIMDELRSRADYVLFDAPPILVVGDAFPLVRASDGVIVVARGGRTSKESAEAVRTTLQALAVENVGVVLTDWAESDGYSYHYDYSSNGTTGLPPTAPAARAPSARAAERLR